MPADCCTSPGIDPPKAPKCSFATPPAAPRSPGAPYSRHGGRLRAGGLRHDPERLRLEHCAHLHPDAGETVSCGCRYRPGTASNLVMYVSAADNNYVGVTGTFLGTAVQGEATEPWLFGAYQKIAQRGVWAPAAPCPGGQRDVVSPSVEEFVLEQQGRGRRVCLDLRRVACLQGSGGHRRPPFLPSGWAGPAPGSAL